MDITVEPTNEPTKTPAVPVSVTDTVQHLAIADRYGVVNANQAETDKLQAIWDYAKSKAQTEDMQEIIWQVIELENVIGSPRIGESRLDKVYKYIKLRTQEARIQQELKNVTTTGYLH